MTATVENTEHGDADSFAALTDDQEMFRDAAARFARELFAISHLRAAYGHGPTKEYTAKTGELGWYAPFVAAEHGGGAVSSRPILDAVVLADVLGRTLQPAPVMSADVSAHLISAGAAAGVQDALLPLLAEGSMTTVPVFADAAHRWDRVSIIRATPNGDGVALRGSAAGVPDLTNAPWFVVVADSGDGDPPIVALVPRTAPGVAIEALAGLDGSRPCATLVLDDVRVASDHVLQMSVDAVEAAFDLAVVLLTAETVGAMRQLFEMTVDYAKTRIAFGRPIGSFQAVKHLLADTSMLIELSGAIVHESAVAMNATSDDVAELASVAKAYVSDAAISVSQACLQVHGGVGYTWEHDLHLFLRRLASDAVLLGDATWHRARLWSVTGRGSAQP